MILAVDVGNSNTVIGVFTGGELSNRFRLSSNRQETTDEVTLKISGLLRDGGVPKKEIVGIIICSVVPGMTEHYLEYAKSILKLEAMVVGPGLKTGLSILYDNPHEVGADRVANSVGGICKYGAPLIIVDLGTAITFDAISPKSEYLGGAIAPGIETSLASLASKAAQLPQVSLAIPEKVIGKTTVQSMQAGATFGTAGMIDSIINKMKKEMECQPKVIATGGHCKLLKEACHNIDEISPDLTLIGLYEIYKLNS